ncbi:MAG: LysR family transcriptional regulator [Rhizobiaceae bacterium]|jgi:molybdate transport system regulatory protein|nr:LysR family transcriptional regulator [Rhizobiaceae bacterium]
MSVQSRAPAIRLRLVWDGFMLGPGKAELLQHIAATGSISAAGKAMGMSYKRAWMLVETMNAAFRMPLVESARGGAHGGGAQLTETGRRVLDTYVAIVTAAEESAADRILTLSEMLGDISEQK